MKVDIVPVLNDNYAYILYSEGVTDCFVVDPVDPEKVEERVAELGLQIASVLTTHKHLDHAGGNSHFAERSIPVLGSTVDAVQACSRFVADGDQLELGSIRIECLATPGHTLGHICYFCEDQETEEKLVFTGDTLFVVGCGRFFEAGADVYFPSLQRLSSLPPDTEVYCGHEYTLANVNFALSVDPENEHLLQLNEEARKKRAEGLPTIPSTIERELLTNPFMRTESSVIRSSVGLDEEADPIEVLQRVRRQKDHF